MNTKAKNWMKRLSSAALVVLGFSACSDSGNQEYPCLYGVPLSDFHFQGTVTDEDQKPIEGIKATLCMDSGIDAYAHTQHVDSASTDAEGKYDIRFPSYEAGVYYGGVQPFVKITLTDIDGDANGGTFANDTITADQMTVVKEEKTGEFKITANKTMRKAAPQDAEE